MKGRRTWEDDVCVVSAVCPCGTDIQVQTHTATAPTYFHHSLNFALVLFCPTQHINIHTHTQRTHLRQATHNGHALRTALRGGSGTQGLECSLGKRVELECRLHFVDLFWGWGCRRRRRKEVVGVCVCVWIRFVYGCCEGQGREREVKEHVKKHIRA